jgi:pilus assembly protein CpaE
MASRETQVPTPGSKGDLRRGALRVQLFGDNADQRADVKSALAALGEPPLEVIEDAADAHVMLPGAQVPDVTMILFNGNEEKSLAFLEAQAAHSPRPALFALMQQRSPGLMKRVLRAGADELLFLPLDTGDATRALLKISEARWRAERREGGIVCAFTSVVGGVGVTTLAADLGLALRHLLGKRVAIVDLDLQSGGLAIALNLEPEVTILPLIRLERKLDSMQMESALTKHSSGVYLLAAPKRIEESEMISDLTVATVLDLMRQLFDFVIVDCGSHVDENAVAAWERSDHLFYVLQQSIAAARSAWRFIDLFERLGLHSLQPKYLLNRYRASCAITDKQIESTLGRPIFQKIPDDERTTERVELAGKELWQTAPGSALAHALEELARRIAPELSAGDAAADGGFLSRIRSAFGPHS